MPVPTSENTLLLFATHLSLSGLAYTSIKVYCSSINNLHSFHSQHDTYYSALTPFLEQVLRSIKQEQSGTCTEKVRLSINVEVMHQIHSVLSRHPIEYQSIM